MRLGWVKCRELINNDDEAAYLDEVERLTSWCQDNCLSLNVSKTKELIVDFQEETAAALHPSYDQWEVASSTSV